MDLNEMAEAHKKLKDAEHKAAFKIAGRLKRVDSWTDGVEMPSRFNCDKMNKAFEDVFGGGK